MSTTLEQAVTDDTGAPELVDDQGQGRIVDPADYDDPELSLPKVDGESIDRIALTFSGTVRLDRSDRADVKLYRDLVLGRDVTLMVEGRCSGTGAKEATNREGDLDVIVGGKAIRVTSVYRPAAEDLERELERTGAATADDAEAA